MFYINCSSQEPDEMLQLLICGQYQHVAQVVYCYFTPATSPQAVCLFSLLFVVNYFFFLSGETEWKRDRERNYSLVNATNYETSPKISHGFSM